MVRVRRQPHPHRLMVTSSLGAEGDGGTGARCPARGQQGAHGGDDHPSQQEWAAGTHRRVVAVQVEDGHVTGAYHVRNPEKLSRVGAQTTLSR